MSAINLLKQALALSAAFLLLAGCSSFQVINERAVTIGEVIKMSQAGVGKDVIISQIDATYSRFKLSPDEIVQLTEAGVDDEVIEVMIESGAAPGSFAWETGWPYENWINYYDYYGNYYGYRYHYPYYSTYIPYMYMTPYVVYRQPGLVGRFYRYAPVGGRRRPYDYYLHERRDRRDDSGKEDDR